MAAFLYRLGVWAYRHRRPVLVAWLAVLAGVGVLAGTAGGSYEGDGIAPEHLPHVFERFYRADPSRSGGSSGLGLAMVEAIVTAHGGTVGVTSEAGRGTAVRVTFSQ